MKKTFLFLSVVLLCAGTAKAQSKNNGQNTGMSNSISAGFSIPFGDFSKTNSFGIGAQYDWSNHRFGKMSAKPAAPIGFTFNAGLDYYFGKEETVGSVTYEYSNLTYIHVYGGVMHNPCTNGYISLTGGPVLGLWDGDSDFGFGVSLAGSIGISDNIGISPSITLMKHSDSDPVYAGGIKVNFIF